MARFVFRLQALLEQREALERERQLEVAVLERERLELEERIRLLQEEIRSHRGDLRRLLGGDDGTRTSGAVDTRGVRLQANAALSVQARTQHLAIKLAGVYERLAAAQERLREASASRKAVELLRERQYEQWRSALEKKEANELDEIGTSRASRSSPDSVLAHRLRG